MFPAFYLDLAIFEDANVVGCPFKDEIIYFVLSNMLKRAFASYESAKSALLLSKVLTQQKRG